MDSAVHTARPLANQTDVATLIDKACKRARQTPWKISRPSGVAVPVIETGEGLFFPSRLRLSAKATLLGPTKINENGPLVKCAFAYKSAFMIALPGPRNASVARLHARRPSVFRDHSDTAIALFRE